MIILKTDSLVARTNEIQKFIAVFAYERFQMMARNVVPFYSVLVKVI